MRGLLVLLLIALAPLSANASAPKSVSVATGYCRIVDSKGAGWTNTGIGTSEVGLVSVALPPLGASDKIEISSLWTVGGTATNTKNLVIRLGTAGCTAQQACSTGTAFVNATMNTSSLITGNFYTTISNREATNSQVAFNSANGSSGTTSGAVSTGSVQTNATLFINFDCATATSSADSCKLESYIIKVCKP